jgi:hypothetical protein
MKRTALLLALLAAAAMLMASVAQAEDYAYIGLKKCSMCHKKDATGNQLAKWEESPHAKAFAVLSTEAGMAKAAKLGVEDPTTSDKCLSCHSTGHGVSAELGGDVLKAENGVSCEACHGPGGGYYKMGTMKQITAGELDGATVGLVVPDAETCAGCHKKDNPEHTGEFDFEAAVKEIAHPIPSE